MFRLGFRNFYKHVGIIVYARTKYMSNGHCLFDDELVIHTQGAEGKIPVSSDVSYARKTRCTYGVRYKNREFFAKSISTPVSVHTRRVLSEIYWNPMERHGRKTYPHIIITLYVQNQSGKTHLYRVCFRALREKTLNEYVSFELNGTCRFGVMIDITTAKLFVYQRFSYHIAIIYVGNNNMMFADHDHIAVGPGAKNILPVANRTLTNRKKNILS